MLIKSAKYVKFFESCSCAGSHGNISARQRKQQNLEDEIWTLFGAFEGEHDEAEQAALREKIWRLAEQTQC